MRQPAPSTDSARTDAHTGSSRAVQQQFDARRSGATEGVTRSGEQPVFAGSKAKGSKAKDSARERSAGAGASPSTRSATGNLWSGFAPEKSSSLSAAGSSVVPQDGGVSAPVLSMAILGVGLVGLLGGVLVAAVRRQRVQVGRSVGGNER